MPTSVGDIANILSSALQRINVAPWAPEQVNQNASTAVDKGYGDLKIRIQGEL